MKMKLIMSAALLSATAAIAFTACTDKLDESATTPETTVDSKIVEAAAYAPSNDDATAKSSTRTEFAPVNPDAHEGYTVSWSSGDEVLTFELVSTDAGSKSNANLTDGYTSTVNILSGNKGSLSINRTNPEAASWDYISFYPSAAILQSSVISSPYNNQYGTTAGITVPHNQKPKANSPDPAASVMAAWAQDITSWDDDSQIKFNFKHLVAYGNMTLTHLNEDVFGDFNKVSSVTFAVPDDLPPITGTFNAYRYAEEISGTMDNNDRCHYNSSANNLYRDVTVTYDEPLTVTDGKVNVWFAIVPTKVLNSTSDNANIRKNGVSEFTVTMTMTNDSGDTETFTRNVKIASNEEGNTNNIRFTTNKVSSFSVNMAKAKTEGDEEDDDITSPAAAVQKAVVFKATGSGRSAANTTFTANLDNWTIESWVRFVDTSTSVSKTNWATSGCDEWRKQVYAPNSYPFSLPVNCVLYPLGGRNDCPDFQFSADYNTKTYAQGGFYWGPDQWVHLAITYDGSAIRFYTNGELNDFVTNANADVATIQGDKFPTTSAGSWTGLNLCYVNVGTATSYGQKLTIAMAQMRLWSKTLSKDEIKENMCNNIPKNTPDLFAYWRMDDIVDGEIVDAKGNFNLKQSTGSFSLSNDTYNFANEGSLGMGQAYTN